MFPGKKKNTTIVSAPTERKVPQALSQAAGKPWLILAVIAALPLVLLLAFTFKSGYAPSSKGGKFDKIVSVKTSAELADEATAALQKNDYQTFSDILQNKIKNDINIVNSKGDPLIVMAATFGANTPIAFLVAQARQFTGSTRFGVSRRGCEQTQFLFQGYGSSAQFVWQFPGYYALFGLFRRGHQREE